MAAGKCLCSIDSVLAEHEAVRGAAGWFDVSHLGRFSWKGPGASAALTRLLSNDVTSHRARTDAIHPVSSTKMAESSTISSSGNGTTSSTGCCRMPRPMSASWSFFRAAFPAVEIEDLRPATAMVAVQGPAAPAALEEVVGILPKRFRTYAGSLGSAPVHLAGTGYTGERGGEVVTDPETATRLLGSSRSTRSTHRPGSGPVTRCASKPGLCWPVRTSTPAPTLSRPDSTSPFRGTTNSSGRPALEGVRMRDRRQAKADRLHVGGPQDPPPRLRPPGRRGSSGTVTSGNYSPVLECGIGLGYLSPPSEADDLEVQIRGKWEPARRAQLPFLQEVSADFTLEPYAAAARGRRPSPASSTDIPRPAWLSPVASHRLRGCRGHGSHLVVGGRTVWVRLRADDRRRSSCRIRTGWDPPRICRRWSQLARELGASVSCRGRSLAHLRHQSARWKPGQLVEWPAARDPLVQAAADRAQQAAAPFAGGWLRSKG